MGVPAEDIPTLKSARVFDTRIYTVINDVPVS